MKNKKVLIGVIIAILVIAAVVAGVLFYFNATKEENSKENNVTIGSVELIAVDQEGEPIPDVTFDLMSADGQKVYGTLETGVDGRIMYYGMPIGTFILKGTNLPEGYEGAGAQEAFEVFGAETTKVEVAFTRTVPRLVITIENEQGETLKDAEIDFYNEDGKYVTTLLAHDDGIAAKNLDGNGVYYIKQCKTQEGYLIDDTSYRVTIDGEDDFTFYTTIVNKKAE